LPSPKPPVEKHLQSQKSTNYIVHAAAGDVSATIKSEVKKY
jgi:hypothetical protein